jgi:hypothetical protein
VKQGEAVFLKFDPQVRGNIAKVDAETFTVTWHRPSVDEIPVENKKDDCRIRVTYRKDDAKGVSFGVPSA